jgi:DNA-binding transcriptional MocR family regulator
MERLTQARVTLDLGVPVVEQLAVLHLLKGPEPALVDLRDRLRERRDTLVAAVRATFPDWTFRIPSGGLSLWCELPGPGRGLGVELADEAERHGVIIAPGPVFAAEGGLDRFVRIPFTRRVDELERAVAGIAAAWAVVGARQSTPSRSSGRVMVA